MFREKQKGYWYIQALNGHQTRYTASEREVSHFHESAQYCPSFTGIVMDA